MSTETQQASTLTLGPAFEIDDSTANELNAAFEPIHKDALRRIQQAHTIIISDASQAREMKVAREMRLSLREVRITAEKKHKEMKESVLRRGRAIDGIKNIIIDLIEPAEKHLLEQEKFAERMEAQRKEALWHERAEKLKPFSVNTDFYKLGDMDEAAFSALFESLEGAHNAKLAAEKKAEEERLAKAKADQEERERVRLENELLKAEAAERERVAAEERRKHEEERKRLENERAASDEKARKEREEIERKARAEREAAEAKARKEREESEAKAAEERRKLAAERDRQLAERRKLEAELAEKKRLEAEAESIRKARADAEAAAPDKQKLKKLADDVRGIQMPKLSTKNGAGIIADISEKQRQFATWIEGKISELTKNQ